MKGLGITIVENRFMPKGFALVVGGNGTVAPLDLTALLEPSERDALLLERWRQEDERSLRAIWTTCRLDLGLITPPFVYEDVEGQQVFVEGVG